MTIHLKDLYYDPNIMIEKFYQGVCLNNAVLWLLCIDANVHHTCRKNKLNENNVENDGLYLRMLVPVIKRIIFLSLSTHIA